MNKVELAPGIIVYKNVISHATTLNNQIESAMSTLGFTWEPAYVRTNNENIIDKNSRDTGSLYVNSYDQKVDNFSTPKDSFFSSLSNLFLEKFKPLHDDYKAYYQTSTKTQESYGLLKYGIGQNFINHIDDIDNTRKISMVYYMNDNYTGGEIVFPRFNLTIKPEADAMIMFPSTYVYNHSVLPVTEGTRYSVVSWLA
jgi:Rps23 Pro-64 3,4-dihydroxylase Tpa1-like proline 4-hydroxylase